MNSEKHNLYERVDRLRGSLHIPFNEPIDSITLIEGSPRIDLEYIPFKTHGFCGIAMVGSVPRLYPSLSRSLLFRALR